MDLRGQKPRGISNNGTFGWASSGTSADIGLMNTGSNAYVTNTYSLTSAMKMN